MRKVLGAGAASLVGVRLLLLAAAACLVLSFGFAVMSTGPAAAHSPLSRTVANVDASNATACPNETVAVFGKPTILRFVLYGVSCSQAHSLIRTYFHDATVQSCRSRGNICAFVFSGGWTCSLPLYAGEAGGDFAGCWRSQSEHFRVFRVTRPAAGAPSAHVYFFPKYGYGSAPFPGVIRPDQVLVGIFQPNPGFRRRTPLAWVGWATSGRPRTTRIQRRARLLIPDHDRRKKSSNYDRRTMRLAPPDGVLRAGDRTHVIRNDQCSDRRQFRAQAGSSALCAQHAQLRLVDREFRAH